MSKPSIFHESLTKYYFREMGKEKDTKEGIFFFSFFEKGGGGGGGGGEKERDYKYLHLTFKIQHISVKHTQETKYPQCFSLLCLSFNTLGTVKHF